MDRETFKSEAESWIKTPIIRTCARWYQNREISKKRLMEFLTILNLDGLTIVEIIDIIDREKKPT